jgi:phosphate transport system substrate-binding protein
MKLTPLLVLVVPALLAPPVLGQQAAQPKPASGAVQVDPSLPSYRPVQGISGSIKSIGSDSMNNLMDAWASDFKRLYPAVNIEIEGKGSATAPAALIENQAQFGPMSRPMKADEIDAFEKKFGYKPTLLRTGIDALAVFVHKDNPLEEVTLDQLKQLFSVAGPNMTWADLGVTGPLAGHPVALYGRNSASGTYGYFKDIALGKNDFKPTVKEQPGSSAVVQAVATDRAGIGYSGIGYVTADVKALRIKRGSGPAVAPTFENALNGRYPLARYLYVYINKGSEPLDPLRAEFVRFIFSREGQEAVIKDGYYPVSPKVAAEDLQKCGL